MANEIGQTILQQLGGGAFLAMTGATVLDTGEGLMIKLPRLSRLSAIAIQLDQVTDTYHVQGYAGRGLSVKPKGEPYSLVQADSLQRLFTSMTGLDTHL